MAESEADSGLRARLEGMGVPVVAPGGSGGGAGDMPLLPMLEELAFLDARALRVAA